MRHRFVKSVRWFLAALAAWVRSWLPALPTDHQRSLRLIALCAERCECALATHLRILRSAPPARNPMPAGCHAEGWDRAEYDQGNVPFYAGQLDYMRHLADHCRAVAS